jgi:hypothetical protein
MGRKFARENAKYDLTCVLSSFISLTRPRSIANGTGGAGVRAAMVGLGAGFGLGSTYAETKREFETLAMDSAK